MSCSTYAKQSAVRRRRAAPANESVFRRKHTGGTPEPRGSSGATRQGTSSTWRDGAALNDRTEVAPIVHDVLRSPGQPLDTGTRAFFEPRWPLEYEFRGAEEMWRNEPDE